MTPKRALVCALMPEFDRDSGSRRVLHIIGLLQEAGWSVTFVSHHEHPGERYVKALQQRGIDVYFGSKKSVDELAAAVQYDLAVLALWEIAEDCVPKIRRRSPSTRIIVDTIDVHFLRTARQVFSRRDDTGRTTLVDAEYGSAMVRELNTYASADGVLAVSGKEANLINDLLADPGLAYSVPLSERPAASVMPFDQRRGMVFVGCYRFPPNARAVEYMCKEIVPHIDPRVLAEHPIYFVGDGLDDNVRAFGHGLDHVQMVGWVPSVEPYFSRARISVVPLQFGAGTKGKLLQALAHGTPTVSTTIGIEGLNLRDGEQVLTADGPVAFGRAISRLLSDSATWDTLCQNGLFYIKDAEEATRSSFERMLEGVMGREPKRLPAATDVKAAKATVPAHEYRRLIEDLRAAVAQAVPANAGVVVVSKGDAELLKLGESRRAFHFPQDEAGRYAGHYPATSEDAIAGLDRFHHSGADYVVLPATASWWLDHYTGLKQHFDTAYDVVFDRSDTCVIYMRRNGTAPQPELRSSVDVGDLTATEPRPAGDTRLIAFLLPQFHPIPENDRWWGQGFTEWTNVTSASPLFDGHYQPRLPADLGFYDLRVPEVREAQAALARAYGIHGFCYYHFWFGGKRLLERPFNDVLASGTPDLPFCLCWANEPWSRRWDGRERDILQPQIYSAEDDLAHIHALLPALADRRAVTIEGKPVFLIYQGKELPDPARTTDLWREHVLKAGLAGIYLIAIETGWDAGWDATRVGFDAKVLFQPQFSMLFGSGAQVETNGPAGLRAYDYDAAWRALSAPPPVSYRRYDTVCPSWDNTARARERAVVLHNSTPQSYQRWLESAIAKASRQPRDHRVVFINAWNEWAEGCHLEPDRLHGRAYLEATRRALAGEAAEPRPAARRSSKSARKPSAVEALA